MGIRVQQSRLLFACVVLIILIQMILLQACANWMGFPTYFDPTTYKNLTDLKPEVLRLYDSFSSDKTDDKKIERISLKLAQVYEYEKGKGEKNKETYVQIRMLEEMFQRHVKNRLEEGVWSQAHLENQKENIAEAFDIAIRTENMKNKNN